jgi:acetyl esterase
VDYSLSPEVRYPVALEECYVALCWTRDNAKSINVDLTNLVVSGDSAGGNLAAALASKLNIVTRLFFCKSNHLIVLAKDRGNTSISYQILFYPVTAAEYENESYNEHMDNEFLSKELMQYFWDMYLNNEQEKELPTAAPLAASVDILKGLPPALIITSEIDVLRTEAELYAKKLTEAGVHNLCVRYLGVQHGFATESGYESQAEAAIAQVAYVLKKHWDLN